MFSARTSKPQWSQLIQRCPPKGRGLTPPHPFRASAAPRSHTLDARQFVTKLGRPAGFRQDVCVFLARKVLGSGTPRITTDFVSLVGPLQRSVLYLTLRQEHGSRAAAIAAAWQHV